MGDDDHSFMTRRRRRKRSAPAALLEGGAKRGTKSGARRSTKSGTKRSTRRRADRSLDEPVPVLAVPIVPLVPVTPAEPLRRVHFRNITGSVDLACPIDLKAVHCRLVESKYEPAKFCGLRFKIRQPKVTLLLFKSGKMVCTGAKTPDDCKVGAKLAAQLVRMALGGKAPIKFRNFGIHNMVATVNLGFRLALEDFALDNCMICDYNPEIFSGVICKIKEPKACFLIFSTGKLVVTGIVTVKGLAAAMDFLFPRLALCCAEKTCKPPRDLCQ
jgi:transcription initiation factor TFIID TATA-box-binding protein